MQCFRRFLKIRFEPYFCGRGDESGALRFCVQEQGFLSVIERALEILPFEQKVGQIFAGADGLGTFGDCLSQFFAG